MNNQKPIPPKPASRLLLWFLKDELAEEVLGDLEEKFYKQQTEKSAFKAKLNYWYQVLNYLRPFSIRYFHCFNYTAMFNNNLKVAQRNLLKHKTFSLINIFGLAIAMAASLLILQYISFELSYDDFRKPTVYRITEEGFMNGESLGPRAQTTPALAPAFQEGIPEVVQGARLVHTDPLMSDPVLQIGDRSFHEEKIYYADASLLDVLSYKMLEGSRDKALTQPNTVVISNTMAAKYFPEGDALGQSLTFHRGNRGKTEIKVTGIFEDIPENSHLHTDFLISFNSLPWNLGENWGWGNFYNYLELMPGTNPAVVEEKMAAVIQKYQGEEMAEWRKGGFTRETYLQDIHNIHLDSHMEAEVEVNGSRSTVQFLTIIAIFILVIAWINYLNLTTAKSVERAKEIGIRKVIGSNRGQLIFQFLSESFLVNLLAVILAIILSQLLMPAFQNLVDGHFTTQLSTDLILKLIGLFLIGTFLSGFYPALVLSSYQPIQILKGQAKHSKNGILLRKVLVVFQFTASIALIVGTSTVKKQLSFMRHQDLGFNIEQTLIVKGPGIKDSTYQNHLSFFKNETNQLTSVKEVSISSSIPGRELSWSRSFYRPSTPENSAGIKIIAIDEDFFELYETTFKAGRNFSKQISTDRGGLIFNETAIRALGFDNADEAIDQNVIWEESDNDKHDKKIVGVVADFNQESLHKQVVPIVFVLRRFLNAPWAGEYYSFRLHTDDYATTLSNIEENWEQAFSNSPFDYFFLDEFFNKQYRADQRFGQIFSLFASLAIIIALLGLFGLSSYVTVQRTKEIGIRKILGANGFRIIRLLSKDFTGIVVIAIVIALPLCYYAGEEWLQLFAYKISLGWWHYISIGIVALLFTWLTVGIQTLKAAGINPVDCLKDE